MPGEVEEAVLGSEQRARRRLARRGAPDSEVAAMVTRDPAGYGGRDTLRQARNCWALWCCFSPCP